jgi:hypothetical protein
VNYFAKHKKYQESHTNSVKKGKAYHLKMMEYLKNGIMVETNFEDLITDTRKVNKYTLQNGRGFNIKRIVVEGQACNILRPKNTCNHVPVHLSLQLFLGNSSRKL